MNEEQKKSVHTIVGKVLSNKMNKTIVVGVERKVKHKLYGKYIKKLSKMRAHDADNVCKMGDLVEIQMCRPLSKTKSWKLVRVLDQAKEITG